MNSSMGHLRLRQRADYTHKHNAKTGRHGWLRLTPAYSVKVVEELLRPYVRPMRVLDPFCGTATTALSAAYHGHESVTTDINPFLVWLGRAKTAQYTKVEIASTRDIYDRAVRRLAHAAMDHPPIHNINRWWSSEALAFLGSIKGAIYGSTCDASPQRNLMLIAFCRSLIALSNAAFNHQSMSFKDERQLSLTSIINMPLSFDADLEFVLAGAAENPEGAAQVILCDGRSLEGTLHGEFDVVITSPPYVNRMSYIRELRPYMYWLDWLQSARQAGELDWTAIGGTWGIATSRLTDWQPDPGTFMNPELASALDRIAHADNKSGAILSNYVAKYLDDMWRHFQSLTRVLSRNAELHYIVGNSMFYGVLLPVQEIFAKMLEELGFARIACQPIRKRNSKKELIEFDVTAVWPG